MPETHVRPTNHNDACNCFDFAANVNLFFKDAMLWVVLISKPKPYHTSLTYCLPTYCLPSGITPTTASKSFGWLWGKAARRLLSLATRKFTQGPLRPPTFFVEGRVQGRIVISFWPGARLTRSRPSTWRARNLGLWSWWINGMSPRKPRVQRILHMTAIPRSDFFWGVATLPKLKSWYLFKGAWGYNHIYANFNCWLCFDCEMMWCFETIQNV